MDDISIVQSQEHYRIPTARVAWVDYSRIHEDFPQLDRFSDEQIDQWILDNFARLSKEQLRLRGIRSSDYSLEGGDPHVFGHPQDYNRAAVAEAKIGDDAVGLIDLKGTGIRHSSNAADQESRYRSIIGDNKLSSAEKNERLAKLRTADHSDGRNLVMKLTAIVAMFVSSGFAVETLGLTAFAAEHGDQDDHQLSVAGGIAAPACSTAVFQNPAGLIYNTSFDLTVQGGAGDSLQNPLLRGGAQGGNGDFGAAALLGHDFGDSANGRNQNQARSKTTTSSATTDAFYGLGMNLDPIKTAIGVAGRTELTPGNSSSFNLGAMIHPKDELRVGATAIGINDGVDEWGLGLAAEPAKGLGFALDSSIDNKTGHFATQPAVVIGNKPVALTVGYGLNGGSRELSDGFSAGASFKLGSSTSWQVYYNQLSSKYYSGISFGF